MSAVPATAPALAPELEARMLELKTTHDRALAPELTATARAQRWELDELIKALSIADVAGRSGPCPPLGARQRLPNRENLSQLGPGRLVDPAPTQQALQTLEWIGRKENVVICGPIRHGQNFLSSRLPPNPRWADLVAMTRQFSCPPKAFLPAAWVHKLLAIDRWIQRWRRGQK